MKKSLSILIYLVIVWVPQNHPFQHLTNSGFRTVLPPSLAAAVLFLLILVCF